MVKPAPSKQKSSPATPATKGGKTEKAEAKPDKTKPAKAAPKVERDDDDDDDDLDRPAPAKSGPHGGGPGPGPGPGKKGAAPGRRPAEFVDDDEDAVGVAPGPDFDDDDAAPRGRSSAKEADEAAMEAETRRGPRSGPGRRHGAVVGVDGGLLL